MSYFLKTRRLVLPIMMLSFVAVSPSWAEIVFNPDTNSYYEVVDQGVTWNQALAAAAALSHEGRNGRLVTIESAAENIFLTTTFGAAEITGHWIGGYQIEGSAEPDGGWTWITGEPITYANWPEWEPNNWAGLEDSIIFAHGVGPDGHYWNDDYGAYLSFGFVVEYPEPEIATEASTWGFVKALFE